MDDLKKVKLLLSDRVEKIDDILTKTAELVEIIPSLQKQKEEDETSLMLLNTISQDFAIEIAPRLLISEIENDRILSINLPNLPTINPQTSKLFESSGAGTASSYIVEASNIIIPFQFDSVVMPKWVSDVNIIIDEYSNKVELRDYLPNRLDRLNEDLGKKFKIVLASYNKCKSGILGVDLCANHLRDILQQVWGGLTFLTSKVNKDVSRNTKDLQLKKPGDRELVSDVLATETFPKNKLNKLLQDMYGLHYRLSDTKFGKNPLNRDFPTLKIYYNEWLSIIDGISGLFV